MNYFNLDNPVNLVCKVWSYQIGHQHMEILIEDPYRTIEPKKIAFYDVHYIQCSTYWQGANFIVEEPATVGFTFPEQLQLFRTKGMSYGNKIEIIFVAAHANFIK